MFQLPSLYATSFGIRVVLYSDTTPSIVASTFILYGDFYVAKKNYFQARHTYQSIVDNYDGDDLREVARQKIAQIDEIENAKKQPKQQDPNSLRPIDEDED